MEEMINEVNTYTLSENLSLIFYRNKSSYFVNIAFEFNNSCYIIGEDNLYGSYLDFYDSYLEVESYKLDYLNDDEFKKGAGYFMNIYSFNVYFEKPNNIDLLNIERLWGFSMDCSILPEVYLYKYKGQIYIECSSVLDEFNFYDINYKDAKLRFDEFLKKDYKIYFRSKLDHKKIKSIVEKIYSDFKEYKRYL